jgi:hypothetical protein
LAIEMVSEKKIVLSTGKLAPTSNLHPFTTYGHQVVNFSFGNIV